MRGATKAWSYLLVPPAPTELAVSLDEVKEWLKISDSAQDDLLTRLIEGATAVAEDLMGRDLINETYKTYRDQFNDYESGIGAYVPLCPDLWNNSAYRSIELRKSRLQSVSSIKYWKDDVLTLVDSSIYYRTEETDYSRILLKDGQAWPSDLDHREQAVEIEFAAGYGLTHESVPQKIKDALLQHIANAYTNRGDCSNAQFLPGAAVVVYQLNRIMDII